MKKGLQKKTKATKLRGRTRPPGAPGEGTRPTCRPGPLTGRLRCLCYLLLISPLLSGCVFASYRRTPTCFGEEEIRFRCCALFADEKLTKVAIDRAMKNGSHLGLAIGAAEEKVDSEALDNLTSAVIAGVIKGLK